MPTSSPDRLPRFFSIQIFSIIFTAIFILHAPLLRLPFFWDEAGFYVPAAYDLAHFHSVIPRTTMDTGHPPLPAAYLALWFTLSGWKPAVARIAMLLLAAFALSNVFLLARRVANLGVAVAATIATAVYPVFFAQSSLAHADLAAAAFTLWGIRLGMERRLWCSQFAFTLAVLSKETAVVTPLAVAIWQYFLSPESAPKREKIRRAAICLVPVLPLAAWLLYHHHATGRFLGDAQFYRYNVTNAMAPLRFLAAFGIRIWHLLGFMNMLALTAATVAAMWFPAVRDNGGRDNAGQNNAGQNNAGQNNAGQNNGGQNNAGQNNAERQRISIPVQLQFALIMLVQLVTFSLLGGALLPRYLLSAYPLVIIIGMSTLRRRITRWEWPAALIVIAFVLALFFDPPYKLAPEDNLTYKDFVELHASASHFLEQHEQGKAVLTAWPASDELTRPYLGYVNKPLSVVAVENFTAEEVFKARAMRSRYQVAFLFSTKYDQPTWLGSRLDGLTRRYFDYHTDLPPELIANLLGGKIVFLERKKAEWVAVLEMEEPGTRAALGNQHSTKALATDNND